ncbi:transmembrane protein 249-like [Polypterus senegalus]
MRLNRYHPFRCETTGVLVMEYRHNSLRFSLIMYILTFVFAGMYLDRPIFAFLENVTYFIILFYLSSWLMLNALIRRRLVIDHNSSTYLFYRNNRLIYQGPLNRIFIRLHKEQVGQDNIYRLIIDGYKIDYRHLCALSRKCEVLDILGRKMAVRLNINYFYLNDVSTKHLIRQWPKSYEED